MYAVELSAAIPQLPSGNMNAEFQKRSMKFRYPLEKKPWGMNEMQIDDPFGNAIRFGEPL